MSGFQDRLNQNTDMMNGSLDPPEDLSGSRTPNGTNHHHHQPKPFQVPDVLPHGGGRGAEGVGLGVGGQQAEVSPTSKEFHESSFASRRKSSQMLSPLRLNRVAPGLDNIDGEEGRSEVEEEGVVLFSSFFEGELARNGIQETVQIERALTSATVQSRQEAEAVQQPFFQFDDNHSGVSASSSSTSLSLSTASGARTPSIMMYQHPRWAKTGRSLKKLADLFAASKERQGVREKAEETVNDEEITAAMFWDMLSELFYNGHITSERIVVLFFFCSDVAISALRNNTIEYFHRFMVWALQYIRSRVCAWVANNGGWETILVASAGELVFIGKVVAACIIAYTVYRMGRAAFNSITHR